MAIPAGTRLGPYEVLSAIGAGGMGEVYRARDSKLGRDVALKVLPDAFTTDAGRMARFEREARLLAGLNHPNIAAIYGLEESSGTPALVMELVEGPTLADRIATGPMPLDDALPIAKQITEALEYAHERGVIHRDLKPANIKVKADGTVKVLDFGLAKALTEDPVVADMNNSPTLTMGATVEGMILGTAAYMSPEQAKGKSVDRRTDIWAFGAVLYEMLTGKELFSGETVADKMASVMKDEPTLDKLPSDMPSAIRTLFRRCLEKNLRRRLSHIAEARVTIEDVLSGAVATTSSEVAPAPTAAATGNRERVAWAAAGICLLAALMLTFVHFRTPPADDARVLSLSVLMPDKTSFSGRSMPAVSPDGKNQAFVAGTGNRYNIWVRDLDSLTARSLDGTEGASEPFWSPDSRYIGFFAGGNLKRVDPTGGPALALCDLPGGAGTGFGASWSSRDVILFTPSNNAALFEVPAAGGSATSLTVLGPGEISHRFPWFLPDGRHFLYLSRNADQSKTAVYMGDLDLKDRRLIGPVQSNVV